MRRFSRPRARSLPTPPVMTLDPDRPNRARRLWSGLVEAIDTLVFPLACRVCGADGLVAPFCAGCRAELVEASAGSCARCAMPIGPWGDTARGCSECRGKSLGFDGAVALGPYQGPIRDLCLALKREPEAWLARWAADLLIEAHGATLRGLGATRVVPVPLHWRRRWQRGYDQAEALARSIGRSLGVPAEPLLRRVDHTPALADLGRAARAKLMRGVFRARGGRPLRGEAVILVDDILTTGATCGAAARALKQAGAGRVVVAVIGRAEGTAR